MSIISQCRKEVNKKDHANKNNPQYVKTAICLFLHVYFYHKFAYNIGAVDGFIACLRAKLRLRGLRMCVAPKNFFGVVLCLGEWFLSII